MKTKQCSKCKKIKPISEFRVNKKHSSGYSSWCKQCSYESCRKWVLTPTGIYSQLKARMKHYHTKPVVITRKEFISWYKSQELKCAYCDVLEEDLSLLNDSHNNVRTRLTIDCMDNDLGYVKGNLVLACNRCNNTKNNFFDYKTFREIAQKYIKPVWEKQLGKKLL